MVFVNGAKTFMFVHIASPWKLFTPRITATTIASVKFTFSSLRRHLLCTLDGRAAYWNVPSEYGFCYSLALFRLSTSFGKEAVPNYHVLRLL